MSHESSADSQIPSSTPHAPAEGDQDLNRSLSNRHIQLIAIGGAIGTGLFLGSGKAIRAAGPSIIVSYLIIGTMLYFVVRAMGELLMYNLDYKSFQDFAADLIGPWAGFFLGWTYWLCWIVTGMAELIGITTYWDFWVKNRGTAALLAAATLFLLLCLNLLTVRMFGELEFWFALIKIIAIISLIVLAIVLAVMKFQFPSGSMASVANLWNRVASCPTAGVGSSLVFRWQHSRLWESSSSGPPPPRHGIPRRPCLGLSAPSPLESSSFMSVPCSRS